MIIIPQSAYPQNAEVWQRDIDDFEIGMDRSYTILLVEDDRDQQELFSVLLLQSKFKVEIVGSAFEALKAIREINFDAMVCDICMPVMNGLSLVSHLRKKTRHCNTPVVMMTAASPDTELEVKALRLGADMFCEKRLASRLLPAQLAFLLQ